MSVLAKLPAPIREHLTAQGASEPTCLCAWDLWDRSTDDPDGRVLTLSEESAACESFGDIRLDEAAAALVGVGLLEEIDAVAPARAWKWSVTGAAAAIPAAATAPAPSVEPVVHRDAQGRFVHAAYPEMDPAERAALLARPTE